MLLLGALMGEAQDVLPRQTMFEHFESERPADDKRLDWRASEGVEWVSGFEGRAPRFADDGAGILFNLEGGEGQAKWLNVRQGSLRFRFRPDWNSGEGPGRYASFCSIGVWRPSFPTIGYWALAVNPTGNQVLFSGQGVEGGETFLMAPVSFQSGRWHDLLLVYSPEATWLYVDGRAFGPGRGVAAAPGDAVCKQYGLQLGNNHDGNQAIGGAIDAFEVYDTALSGFVQRRDACALRARIEPSVPLVELRWNSNGKELTVVRRRTVEEVDWKTLASLTATNRYVDTSPELMPGVQYEYSVGQRRLRVAIGHLPPAEHRGRVLILATRKVASRLSSDLERFKLDLAGDGWIVEQQTAPEHNSQWKGRYRRRVAEVKSAIVEFHQQSPHERNVALLIGNIPIPYSGMRAEDGHYRPNDDHQGAWPCDAYYGDVDGIWTDVTVSHVNHSHHPNTNLPGDGKFDQDYLPSSLEVAVGRINFVNLPGITGDSLPGHPARSDKIETALLQQYFDKNHMYRTGQIRYMEQAIVKSYLPVWLSRNIENNAFHNGSSLFDDWENNIYELDFFATTQPALLGFLAGYGGSSSIASGLHQTQFVNRPGYSPKAAFLILYSSWIADWNLKDNFLKATLAGASTGLATMSSLHGQWNLSALGLGEPLATCYLETANKSDEEWGIPRSFSILGDITLRLHVIPPVKTFSALRHRRSTTLSWTTDQTVENELGCFVYRSRELMGPYRRISGPEPIRGWEFIDSKASRLESYYMVRRVAVATTPGGSYTNLSQGRFVNSRE